MCRYLRGAQVHKKKGSCAPVLFLANATRPRHSIVRIMATKLTKCLELEFVPNVLQALQAKLVPNAQKTKPAGAGNPQTPKRAKKSIPDVFCGLDEEHRKQVEILQLVAALEQHATEWGLDSQEMLMVTQFAFTHHLEERITARLVWTLVPSSDIKDECILQLLGFLGMKHVTNSLKVTVFDWLLCVIDCLSSRVIMHQLYDVIWFHLRNCVLRTRACQLLYFVTTTQHITKSRVAQLLDMLEICQKREQQQQPQHQPQPTESPYVAKLLKLFYYLLPDVFADAHDRVDWFMNVDTKHVLRALSTELVQKMKSVREHLTETVKKQQRPTHIHQPVNRVLFVKREGTEDEEEEKTGSNEEDEQQKFGNGEKTSQLARREPGNAEQRSATRLKQMQTVPQMVENLWKIMTDRCALRADITSPTLSPEVFRSCAIALALTDKTIVRDVIHWLECELYFEFSWKLQSDPMMLSFIFERLISLLECTQELVPAGILCDFYTAFFESWDGSNNIDHVTSLLSHMMSCHYEILHATLLSHVGQRCETWTVKTKAKVLGSFVSLLRRWANMTEFPTSNNNNKQSESSQSITDNNYEHKEWSQHITTMFQLTEWLFDILCRQLEAESDHPLIQHVALECLELVSGMHLNTPTPFVVPPPTTLITRLFVSHSAMSVSRLCGVMVQYKRSYEKLKLSRSNYRCPMHSLPPEVPSGLQFIGLINSFVWTLCTALWRNRLFQYTTDAEKSQDFLKVPSDYVQELAEVAPDHVNSLLSVTHSLPFIHFSKQYLVHLKKLTARDSQRERDGNNQEEETTLHPDMIEDSFKYHYIDFLRENSLDGLYEFLYTFISSLVARRVKKDGHNSREKQKN